MNRNDYGPETMATIKKLKNTPKQYYILVEGYSLEHAIKVMAFLKQCNPRNKFKIYELTEYVE